MPLRLPLRDAPQMVNSWEPMMKLWTIGYEGSTPEAFDITLIHSRIQCVVDARAIAMSRRKGFAKTALRVRLASHGIEYEHLRGLGDPKEGRNAAKSGEWKAFLDIYNAHMQTSECIRDLSVLANLARTRRIALLCYETDPSTCHRKIVAEHLALNQRIEIVHLIVAQGKAHEQTRTRHYTHQGMAAA